MDLLSLLCMLLFVRRCKRRYLQRCMILDPLDLQRLLYMLL